MKVPPLEDLSMWRSGQSTWAPCAVQRDTLRSRGSNLNLGVSACQRILLARLHIVQVRAKPDSRPRLEGAH